MRKALSEAAALLRETFVRWMEDGVVHRGASLAYYVLLSLGPLLLLLMGGLQIFFAQEAVRDRLLEAIARFVSARAASTARTVLEDAPAPAGLSMGSILTVAALLLAATAVFANVRGSLNAIWGVDPKAAAEDSPPGARQMLVQYFLGFLRTRLRGSLMIAIAGVILLFSFVLTSAAGVLTRPLEDSVPFAGLWIQTVDTVLSIAIVGLLFGAIFRTMPERRIGWSAVWVGAYVTASAFVLAKQAIAYFIATASWTTYYGPGTSVVAFVFWVFLSAQIFFFGAEFTQVWTRRHGQTPSGG